MKFAIAICVVAIATLAYSQPLTIAAKQSNRPSPPVASPGIQRPQPPVKKPTQQQQQSIPSAPVTSIQEPIAQPQKEVPEIIPQRPNVGVNIMKPQDIVAVINQRPPNAEKVDFEVVNPQHGVEYFNGKVIYEPHYPPRY